MKNLNYSIFFKLVILIVIFIVLVNLSIGFLIRFSFDKPPREFFDKPPHFIHEYVIREIGIPPDTENAAKVCEEMNLSMRIDLTDVKWSTDESVPVIEELQREHEFRFDRPDFQVRYKGRPYFISRLKNGFVIFSPNAPKDYINKEKAIISVIVIVTLLASILYFSLRWIFGPIKILSEGVKRISEGDFESDIVVNRKDELGKLADSVNSMKTSIAKMIKSKESLLVDVSHELRSPLTRLKLAAEFIENEKTKTRIRDDIKEMETMITELLETYRTGSETRLEKYDIVKLTSEIILKTYPDKVSINSEVKEAEISMNRVRMEIAIRNILDNAVKYSDGKPVEIEIYKNKNERICISIKDKGRGIDSEELENIFEPFYRIDKSRDKKVKGYGLGLSLVKKILNEHNAEFEVRSSPGNGTEFKIIFSAEN